MVNVKDIVNMKGMVNMTEIMVTSQIFINTINIQNMIMVKETSLMPEEVQGIDITMDLSSDIIATPESFLGIERIQLTDITDFVKYCFLCTYVIEL